jgi:hypothetical protein
MEGMNLKDASTDDAINTIRLIEKYENCVRRVCNDPFDNEVICDALIELGKIIRNISGNDK